MYPSRYLGVMGKNEQNQPLAMIYPEGQFALINHNGTFALMVAGQTNAIPVDKVVVFRDLDGAVEWVKNPS